MAAIMSKVVIHLIMDGSQELSVGSLWMERKRVSGSFTIEAGNYSRWVLSSTVGTMEHGSITTQTEQYTKLILGTLVD